MRKFEKKLKDTLVEILCDICGKTCSCPGFEDASMAEYATLEASWGYCSASDGNQHHCEMCEDCFEKVTSFIESIKK
jgi:hypothetical protein